MADQLTALTMLNTLSQPSRDLFEQRLVKRAFAKGDTLIDKGDQVSGAYFVLGGQLRVYTYGPGGKEATLYMIDPGETCVLALNSLFNDMLYPAWVEAETDTVVGVLPGIAYRTLFSSDPAIQDLTVRALSTAVFRLMAELEQIHASKLDQRLASFLVNRASSQGMVKKTQREIAAHIGTTREVVARLLGQLAADGLIATGRGQVRVLDARALAAQVMPME